MKGYKYNKTPCKSRGSDAERVGFEFTKPVFRCYPLFSCASKINGFRFARPPPLSDVIRLLRYGCGMKNDSQIEQKKGTKNNDY